MQSKMKKRLSAVDILLLTLTALPILVGIAVKVLFLPPSVTMDITGAYVLFTVPFPLGGIPISEAQINSALVTLSILFLCLFLTRGLKEKPETLRQHIAEWIVEKTESLVKTNMGDFFKEHFTPFVGAIFALSALSSLLSLFGLFPPTSDLNVVAGWAILVALLITYYKMKCGPIRYFKSFTEPTPLLLPLNLINEVATPVAMAFRHYGNIMSGALITVLIKTALDGLSAILFGWLPAGFGKFPYLELGLPAVLSVYFDLFSGCLQAFIFAMLTMLYVAGAFPAEEYAVRVEARNNKKQTKKSKT